MSFDIVRGKIAKPEQSNQLIAAVKEYMEKNFKYCLFGRKNKKR